MLSAILKILAIIVLGGILLLGGLSVYAYFFSKPDTGLPDMPDIDEAQYALQIKNTGGLILTNSFEVYGNDMGSRIFILHGFWELSGKEFKYRDYVMPLDEAVFGEITVRGR